MLRSHDHSSPKPKLLRSHDHSSPKPKLLRSRVGCGVQASGVEISSAIYLTYYSAIYLTTLPSSKMSIYEMYHLYLTLLRSKSSIHAPVSLRIYTTYISYMYSYAIHIYFGVITPKYRDTGACIYIDS